MAPADFISIDDVTNDELAWLIEQGGAYAQGRGDGRQPLAGRPVPMLFEKPSTRTRVARA